MEVSKKIDYSQIASLELTSTKLHLKCIKLKLIQQY